MKKIISVVLAMTMLLTTVMIVSAGTVYETKYSVDFMKDGMTYDLGANGWTVLPVSANNPAASAVLINKETLSGNKLFNKQGFSTGNRGGNVNSAIFYKNNFGNCYKISGTYGDYGNNGIFKEKLYINTRPGEYANSGSVLQDSYYFDIANGNTGTVIKLVRYNPNGTLTDISTWNSNVVYGGFQAGDISFEIIYAEQIVSIKLKKAGDTGWSFTSGEYDLGKWCNENQITYVNYNWFGMLSQNGFCFTLRNFEFSQMFGGKNVLYEADFNSMANTNSAYSVDDNGWTTQTYAYGSLFTAGKMGLISNSWYYINGLIGNDNDSGTEPAAAVYNTKIGKEYKITGKLYFDATGDLDYRLWFNAQAYGAVPFEGFNFNIRKEKQNDVIGRKISLLYSESGNDCVLTEDFVSQADMPCDNTTYAYFTIDYADGAVSFNLNNGTYHFEKQNLNLSNLLSVAGNGKDAPKSGVFGITFDAGKYISLHNIKIEGVEATKLIAAKPVVGTNTVTSTVYFQATDYTDICIIAAIYDGSGMLLGTDIIQGAQPAVGDYNGKKDVTVPFESQAVPSEMRVFAVQDIASIRPVCKCLAIPITD